LQPLPRLKFITGTDEGSSMPVRRHHPALPRSRAAVTSLLVATAVGCALLCPTVGSARAAKDEGTRPAVDSPGTVFGKLASAFEAGDATSLATLVHHEGLTVTDQGVRSSEYSPSQAVYYFKNLFQGQRTLLFAYKMTQDDVEGGRARAMAEWKRRRVDSDRVVELQIVLVLALDDGRWRLSEINMIR
jgi:hypothetical protein